MKAVVRFFAGMPMPLLLGLTVLALLSLVMMASALIWPGQMATITFIGMIGTWLVILGWLTVIIYEQRTGKRVGR